MFGSKTVKQHWLRVSVHFLTDALLFALAFWLGTRVRFAYVSNNPQLIEKMPWQFYVCITLGGLFFSSSCYILGHYAPQISRQTMLRRSVMLLLALAISFVAVMGMSFWDHSSRPGRGIVLLSVPVAYLAFLLHHWLILREQSKYRERAALIVTGPFDELEMRVFDDLWADRLQLAGVIHSDGYEPAPSHTILGPTSRLRQIVQQGKIDRILCTNKGVGDPTLFKHFCELRYSGTMVTPLIVLCEEIYQCVPLDLMTYEWLMGASDSPHMLYIKKLKRGFDIAVSIAGMIFLGPVLLLGMLAVKLTSAGPVFYRQRRAGRFGRQFEVIKLRTMRVDAEKNGAAWAQANDPRVTPIGGILRKYRIDEIPQLINVFRGEMSFVGPRPERPEFIADLAQQIPFYQERLMIQPGITGWAQVRFPYGASVEDARRKLEYDLYYMKNMSIFLDLFILLDTVRIVVTGGLNEQARETMPYHVSQPQSVPAGLPEGALAKTPAVHT